MNKTLIFDLLLVALFFVSIRASFSNRMPPRKFPKGWW